jgi:hypothetical protein
MSQRWTSFGHAMWRCEVAGLSILIDPVLSPTHHDGVFSVHPPRSFDLDALDDPIVVVTHRHPDHFDPDTLAALARRPDRLLLTADPLVAEVGQRLGFRWTRVLPPMEPLDLGGAALLPTPSRAHVPEWGMLVRSEGALVWNQVDTALGRPDDVRALLKAAAALGFGGPVDLLIARWCPILQTVALHGGGGDFPFTGYGAELERIAAVNAGFIVPGAASTRYADDEHWLNRYAYPVSEARALEDLAARLPGVPSSPLVVGRRFEVGGGVRFEDAPGPVVALEGPDPRPWRPLDAPPLRDDAPVEAGRVARVEAWVETALRPALARWRWDLPAVLRLEVLHGEDVRRWGFRVSAGGVEDCDAEEWDALVCVASGALDAVIAGRAPWGRALLDGRMRSVRRGYRVGPKGLERMKLPSVFLYAALPYEAAFERWVWGRVAEICQNRR